jgi:alkanesulfonate monooxygenase SsuD/methylene tetrahydromethanopterin reductase-like flavin-dependent oxidoreductase (luciferase family)
MKEYVEIIQLAISGEKINYSGKIFSLKDFSILSKPLRGKIPIYLAAINQKMVELTWDVADGVIFYLRPKEEMKKTISIMQKKRKIDTSLQIITCVDHDSEKAINRAKKTLSFYIAVGDIYRKFLHSNGYSEEMEIIYNEYKKEGLKNLEKLVPDEMLDDLCIAGTPEIAIKKLNTFRDVGIELPIIQFNPIGNVKESFQLLTDTFSGELNE